MESCPEAKTLEQVMEWLIAHEDELNSEQSTLKEGPTKLEPEKEDNKPMITDEDGLSQDGGSNETVANMADRKKITVEEAQRIIAERLSKRAEEERKKEIEDEKRRRLDGQKMAETRAELQDQERIRLAQQIRKEKLEKEMYRKQVLAKIAMDRANFGNQNQKPVDSSSSFGTTTSTSTSKNVSKTPTTECKIALRFPDGSNLVHKFTPQEQLAAVRLFVQMEKGTQNEIEFVAPPNKKLTESHMNDTLETLGLCPASRLEVKYTRPVWTDMD